ncbi:MAG: copper amine oxidase N-terminal domain-containing protein [Firmicutes bacterium]|nr:copper amine oxidase N-terminal domain-containing protein [Bacillota bacterium]
MKKDYGAYFSRLLLVITLVFVGGFILSTTIKALAAAPGSATDPLITQAWLEEYVQEQIAPLKQRLIQLEQKLGGNVNILLTIGSAQAYVNGKTTTIPAPPMIMGAGYTMAPARFIGEALGLKVEWDAKNRLVTFNGGGQSITLTIGSDIAMINSQPYTMPIAPLIANGYTLVYVRFISEAFHCQVEWEQNKRQITVTKGSLK